LRSQKKQDRPDPFWENRNGQVGVPGLGLIDDNLSTGNRPPPTLNKQGEAQARGNTAMLIASSISKAVNQATQDERHGQRHDAKSTAPHQWENVLGEERVSVTTKTSSASAQSRAARSVSQIAATSRNRSRSRES
jgi:hypothetical protein